MKQGEFHGREADTFDVRASLRTVIEAAKGHRLLVLATCVASVAVVAVYIRLGQPIYLAEATLMIERDTDQARDAFYANWAVFRKDDARSEIELMTSGPVLQQVVERERLTYDDVYHTPTAHAAYLWQTSSVGKAYRKWKLQWFPEKDELHLTPAEIELGKTVTGLRSGVAVDPVAESNVGKLRLKGPSSRVAKIANVLLETYMADRRKRYVEEAHKSYAALDQETAAAGKALADVGERRTKFVKDHDITLDFSRETLQMNKLTEMEMELAANEARLAAQEASAKEIDRMLALQPATRTISTVYELNSLRETLKQKRMDLQAAQAIMSGKYRPESPELTEVNADIERLDRLIAGSSEKVEKSTTEGLNDGRQTLATKRDALASDIAGGRAAMQTMRASVQKLRTRVAEMPELQNQMRAYDREVLLAQEKYQQLSLKRASAAVAEATAGVTEPSLRVVEFAAPSEQNWPKAKILYPAALLAGLLFGVLAAVARSYTSGRINHGDIERDRDSYPIYGTLAMEGHPVLTVRRGARANAD